MEELLEKLKSARRRFEQDAALRVTKGNYTAGARSRKESIVLTGLLKEWRKASVVLTGLLKEWRKASVVLTSLRRQYQRAKAASHDLK